MKMLQSFYDFCVPVHGVCKGLCNGRGMADTIENSVGKKSVQRIVNVCRSSWRRGDSPIDVSILPSDQSAYRRAERNPWLHSVASAGPAKRKSASHVVPLFLHTHATPNRQPQMQDARRPKDYSFERQGKPGMKEHERHCEIVNQHAGGWTGLRAALGISS